MLSIKKILGLYIAFSIVLICLTYVFAPAAEAASLWDKIGCRENGDCQLKDFAQLAVNVAGWILGVTGSLTLIAFVYGGVLFLISAGSSERVNKAKQVIVGAVVGLVIVFASYMIIGFVFKGLGVNLCGESNAWAQTGWFGQCTPNNSQTWL